MQKAITLLSLILFLWPSLVKADVVKNLSGRILINVEKNGEAWYVYPENNKRYYLGRPHDAFKIMRELGLGIAEINFQKIAQAGMLVAGDLTMAKRLAGRIVIQTERNGEAWYINPVDLKKYYLGRPSDAFRVMRELSLGITKTNLALIHKASVNEAVNQYSSYEIETIKTQDGDFKVDIATIDLSNPKLKIIVDTADDYNCKNNCAAKSLVSFVLRNNGFCGINGTYFCSASGCGVNNYYFYPAFNFRINKMINEDQLKYWTTGPIMAFDQNNKFYYFKDSRDFKSVVDFENKYGVKLQAAIGNKPRLIENGMNLLIDWEVDAKQRQVKSLRNAIGYKDNKLYLVIARHATVPDLANIMQELGVAYALNLDGGYSSALYYNDEYMVGPGRDIPNAIIFSEE